MSYFRALTFEPLFVPPPPPTPAANPFSPSHVLTAHKWGAAKNFQSELQVEENFRRLRHEVSA